MERSLSGVQQSAGRHNPNQNTSTGLNSCSSGLGSQELCGNSGYQTNDAHENFKTLGNVPTTQSVLYVYSVLYALSKVAQRAGPKVIQYLNTEQRQLLNTISN